MHENRQDKQNHPANTLINQLTHHTKNIIFLKKSVEKTQDSALILAF